MATKAELERSIRNIESLIDATEQAAEEFRRKARQSKNENDIKKFEAEAASKARQVPGLAAQLRGLKAHLRSL